MSSDARMKEEQHKIVGVMEIVFVVAAFGTVVLELILLLAGEESASWHVVVWASLAGIWALIAQRNRIAK